MKNTKSKKIRRLVGVLLMLAGAGMAIGGFSAGNTMLGAIGLGVIKAGGLVIKIALIVKLCSRLRRRKTVEPEYAAENLQEINEAVGDTRQNTNAVNTCCMQQH